MSAPIPLRRDFDASQLRGLARTSNDGPQARRILSAIYDGATRTEASQDRHQRVAREAKSVSTSSLNTVQV
jgi:hypothetical protein